VKGVPCIGVIFGAWKHQTHCPISCHQNGFADFVLEFCDSVWIGFMHTSKTTQSNPLLFQWQSKLPSTINDAHLKLEYISYKYIKHMSFE
jgi:hypothetical protein